MSNKVAPSVFEYLNQLKKNNTREWFAENRTWFDEEEAKLKTFFSSVLDALREDDDIEKMKTYRIYRDIRFSKDKTPFKLYRSCSFVRATEALRGSYHVEVSPGASFIAVGFWQPNKEDLLRIRKEFEMDASEINEIINHPDVQKYFGGFHHWNSLKTAPKGFDKTHPNIELIRKKDFMFLKKLSDKEVLSPNFYNVVLDSFKASRPFLDYMSDVLTTNTNGESIL